MFDSLQEKLGGIFANLRRAGALKEADVVAALREVRVALLEADVALPVVKDFIDKVRAKAVGQEVLRSVTPGQMVIKIVHDALVDMLGRDAAPVNVDAPPPAVVLMVGLQGSGKTTTTAKIAKRLQEKEKKRVLMASLDTRRPAAQEQLKILGEQVGVATLPIIPGQLPLDITKRALTAAKLQGFDVLMLDTAGRLHVDAGLMAEVQAVRDASDPVETLLVVDSLTGQDAVNVAKEFDGQVGITGVVLTRMDGDGRGGAALSMRAVTGKPIKLVGVGEKLDALEDFHPDRVANRILGMGDVVSLVEKAAETIDQQDAERIAKKMKAGTFDLEDLKAQLKQMTKLGGMGGILGLLPGISGMQKQMAQASIDDRMLKRQIAIIDSMTPKERRKPDILNASRKRRVAAGAGVEVQDINRLLKMHRQMADVMKKVGKGGMKGLMGALGGMPGGLPGGGLPPGFNKFLPRR
jgi:signal recognition particle subunit SRP54